MSIVAMHRLTRRFGRRAAGLFALVSVIGAVGVHHSGVAMGDMHHEGMGASVLELCLGALSTVGAAIVAVAFGLFALGRWPLRRMDPVGVAFTPISAPAARARAGPPALALLCVSRC